jgi:uncharacterized protein (TIGR02217 family)
MGAIGALRKRMKVDDKGFNAIGSESSRAPRRCVLRRVGDDACGDRALRRGWGGAMSNFHEVTFPLDIALNAEGGPVRKTDVVALASGHEQRNARWAGSRRSWNAGYGVKSIADIERVTAFFEARRGRLYGFRFRDPFDSRSSPYGAAPSPIDQSLGVADGQTLAFALVKTYASGGARYVRPIPKPVAGSVRAAVDGVETEAFTVDETTGIVTFAVAPPQGAEITAGYLYDCPARFDSDALRINLAAFRAGDIPSIPLIEVLL